jgi:hypothetical protein
MKKPGLQGRNKLYIAGRSGLLYREAAVTDALQVHIRFTAALTVTTTTTSNIGVVHCSETSITSYQAMRQSQKTKWIY